MLRDKQGHVYKFATDFKLGAGKAVTIHTGNGSNTAAHRYWKLKNYVWNNSGDKATLKNPSGTVIDTCSWGSSGSYTNC